MNSELYSQVPPRYGFRTLLLGDSGYGDDDRVHVEFFTNEKSFKERLQLYFIKNQRSSLRIRIFNLLIKLLTCALYVVRVITDKDGKECPDADSNGQNHTADNNNNNCWRSIDPDKFQENPDTHWERIIWVDRSEVLWVVQVTVAIISLLETCLVQYLSYKGNILQQILSVVFILELINTVPFVVTIFWQPLRHLFVPVFLNCWLAKQALDNMFNDLHRVMQKSHSALAQQLMTLCATLMCLAFTTCCGIEHLQRGGNRQFGLFESLYFVIVTFATVGYGDIYPDIWISQLFMMCMIVVTLIALPRQFEQLAYTWMERQKQGGAYSSHRAQTEKHVVVCTTTLQSDTVMDFLNEFYAHPKLQDYHVVLLSPCELDSMMKMLLQVPLWAQRVIYIQGSALKDTDLARCRVQDAEACFILAARNYEDREAADQHTILRSWAIKDFARHCPQYVQIFRPENKFHVKFAGTMSRLFQTSVNDFCPRSDKHVVCEDEFKYALLANNCLCPATSTLVTLLMHTSRGHFVHEIHFTRKRLDHFQELSPLDKEGQTSHEEWQRLYGRCSGNEIYHITLGDSKFFGEYKGKSFTYASFHAHRKYGVSLVGIQISQPGSTIQLNPGPRHIMKDSDICFYMNITKEENSAFILAHPNQDDPRADKKFFQSHESSFRIASAITSVGTIALEMQNTRVSSSPSTELQREGSLRREGSQCDKLNLPKDLSINCLHKRQSIAPVPAVLEFNDIRLQVDNDTSSEESFPYIDDDVDEKFTEFIRGFPPVTPYVGTSPTLCHLMKEKRPICCLQLAQACEHCSYKTAKEYNWHNRAVIVAADNASNGLYNFIVPLRSHARPKSSLNPIVLILEKSPDIKFLETICHFPMIYWMTGSIDNLDDLLRAGINLADNVVIVNKESSNSAEEDTLSDCNTIVAVQTIYRMFPSANIITELSQSSNMRFMQFQPNDYYSYTLSKLEKKEKDRGSHISYMFRLPFAAGNVFSASMLDTLLYQAFVKDYLITFVRLLLGIDQAVGSGHLSCMKITRDDLWIRTYGRLYQKLCATTCEVPIGIYRTRLKSHQTATPQCSNSSQISRDQSALNLAFRNSVVTLNMGDAKARAKNNPISPERHEISQMVKCRMQSLGQPPEDYEDFNDQKDTISYVIINPSYDLKLVLGDIIYLIKPSSLSLEPSPLMDERKHLKKRGEPAGMENADIIKREAGAKKILTGRVMNDGNSRIPIVYMDDNTDEDDYIDQTTNDNTEWNKNILPLDGSHHSSNSSLFVQIAKH